MDGSVTRQGARAGIVLINPDNDELEFMVRFQFQASNNESEYEEALLQGIRLTEQAEAKCSLVRSDSQVVT